LLQVCWHTQLSSAVDALLWVMDRAVLQSQVLKELRAILENAKFTRANLDSSLLPHHLRHTEKTLNLERTRPVFLCHSTAYQSLTVSLDSLTWLTWSMRILILWTLYSAFIQICMLMPVPCAYMYLLRNGVKHEWDYHLAEVQITNIRNEVTCYNNGGRYHSLFLTSSVEGSKSKIWCHSFIIGHITWVKAPQNKHKATKNRLDPQCSPFSNR